jgi:hypothetical protein
MTKNNYKQEVLMLETCIKVVSDSENGMSQWCLAKKYNCCKTQIKQILKNKHLQEKWHQNGNKNMKRDEILLDLFNSAECRLEKAIIY